MLEESHSETLTAVSGQTEGLLASGKKLLYVCIISREV